MIKAIWSFFFLIFIFGYKMWYMFIAAILENLEKFKEENFKCP